MKLRGSDKAKGFQQGKGRKRTQSNPTNLDNKKSISDLSIDSFEIVGDKHALTKDMITQIQISKSKSEVKKLLTGILIDAFSKDNNTDVFTKDYVRRGLIEYLNRDSNSLRKGFFGKLAQKATGHGGVLDEFSSMEQVIDKLGSVYH